MKLLIYLIIIFLSFINTSYSQNHENYVARFNGFYSYATLIGNPLFNATAFTLEAWVNPVEIGPSTMSVIGNNYQTGFFLGIQASGRIVFYPKGSSSLRSRVSGTVPKNQWTHIAATYNGSVTSLYINGILDTMTTAITGALTMNNDSIRFGADRVGIDNLFYNGYLDNVRFWRTARSASDIKDDRFIPFSMYSPSGKYASLSASFLFNNDLYSGGGYSIGANGRNITYINYSNKAVNISDYNNNLVLNGTTDYCSHENHNGWFSMPGVFTLEAWIKRDTSGTQPLYQNIISKSGGTNVFDYGLYFSSSQGDLFFAINNYTRILQAPAAIQTAQWTHVAASYNPADGKAVIYINGDSAAGTYFSGNPSVQNNPYHIFFGATGASNNSANKFKGQLDDIKIWYKSERTAKEIKENIFCNKIRNMQTYDSVIYVTFDKFQSGVHVGGNSHIGGLKFFGNASISSSHANTKNLSSPVIHDPLEEFNSSSSVMSYNKFFVPDANASGVTDSIYISDGSPVNNLRVCVLLSHSYTRDIDLILIAPSGSSVYLLEKNGFSGNDVMTIFSDAADSVPSYGINVNGPGINSPFSPNIKATQSLSVFNGQNRKGWWKLKVIDYASPDIGYVHGWGLNMKAQKNLNLSALIQGFYNSASNKMIRDTAKVILRNALPPYAVVDSSKSVLDSNGKANFYFNKPENGKNYYVILNHRNSVETWSSSVFQFNNDTATFDFTAAAAKAFGNNQLLADTSPVRFAIYGGDVNRDGNVDLTDVIKIYNSAANFESGYKVTDVTGDNSVNLTDIILAFNNSGAFVTVRKP